MSNLEHYFENLLYHGEDIYGGINKQSLTPDVQDAVEVCAQYIIYSLFGNRKAFEKFIKDAPAADVVEVVRCADCKYIQCNMRQDGTLPKGVDEYECRHWCGSCDPTDFCSYGERKDGDGDDMGK